MTNIHLKREVERLKEHVCRLGTLVEESMQAVAAADKTHDYELARNIINNDAEIDKLEVDIEEECLKMLALYQPVATDLRFVTSCLKMNNDMERIGDLCCNIAERILDSEDRTPVRMPEVMDMFNMARRMVKDAISAMIDTDTMLAADVMKRDDEVDDNLAIVFKKTIKELKETPDKSEELLNNLGIARNLERIADYATNICEDIFYMADGVIVRHNIS